MKKTLIIFGSTTGNTKELADIIKRTLNQSGIGSELKDVMNARIGDLTSDHDLVLLGCPAYGDDTIELQEDFDEFYEKMEGVSLENKAFAVFAPGDSSYEHFCGSVDKLEDRMEQLGGRKLVDGLKIDGDPLDSEEEIVEWVESITATLN